LKDEPAPTPASDEPVPTTPRSYEDHAQGQQLYAVIESCTSLETLWAKIDSGKWDWLGTQVSKGKRTYLLGRPPMSRSEAIAALSVQHKDAEVGQHGVEVRTPHRFFRGVSSAWTETRDAAEIEFDRQVQALQQGPGSGLYKVTLVLDGQPARHEIVARILPNRL
jgi:hypothetical protein